jgi:glutathione synthase
MKLAFFVNRLETERAVFTTTRLAMSAVRMGHDVWYIDADDLAYDADEKIRAWATLVPKRKFKLVDSFMSAMKGDKVTVERISVSDLDVLMLRSDPALETGVRAWAQSAGIMFGRLAMRHGVMVLNDPNALTGALDKVYLRHLPNSVRPRTVITRDRAEVKAFVAEVGGHAILKQMTGSSGQIVFVVTPNNRANLNQMVEALTRDGYIFAEEYMPGAETGSTRMFLMNGEPLREKGKYAAFQWIRKGDEMRVNIHTPGSTAPIKLTDIHFRIAEAVRPQLVQDGMFLAGLQIVDDKLIDIDVFSPGGLGNAQSFEKVNFSDAVINALVRKVEYMKYYNRRFDNVDICTL